MKRNLQPVYVNPEPLIRTVQPDVRLEFNEWALYIKAQLHREPKQAKVVKLRKQA